MELETGEWYFRIILIDESKTKKNVHAKNIELSCSKHMNNIF